MTAAPTPHPASGDALEPGAYPTFRLPAFPRFQPALRRPDITALEAHCRAWLDSQLGPAHTDSSRAFADFLDHRTTLWNLLTYPTTDTERTKVICHWIDVLFSIDDLFAHASPARQQRLGLHQLNAVFDDEPPVLQAPYPRVLARLATGLRAEMPPGLWRRFAHDMREFAAACHTERNWHRDGMAVDLAVYENSRIKSVGECCFPLLEYGLGIDLTGHPAAEELRRLNHLVARHWIGVNDIFSYRKELYSGDTVNEITLALADNGGDLQAAVDRIAATVLRAEDEFCARAERLLHTLVEPDLSVGRYVEALRWMIAGNLEWSYITSRYNGHGHIWDGRPAASVILTPHRTFYRPAPAGEGDPTGQGQPS
ncbi:terpene synthase family protein [Streptomyces rochei]|uniref:terpene synthase family protein n=1 Tax=Streptomyces rochei TaxID=1928 RepID=UPI003685B8C4